MIAVAKKFESKKLRFDQITNKFRTNQNKLRFCRCGGMRLGHPVIPRVDPPRPIPYMLRNAPGALHGKNRGGAPSHFNPCRLYRPNSIHKTKRYHFYSYCNFIIIKVYKFKNFYLCT